MYLFQNELPNNGLKSNKLDGSFFFYPRMSVSSFSLLVLLLSYVNLFKELFSLFASISELISFCLRFRSFSKADAKVLLFLEPPKHFRRKVCIFMLFIWLIDMGQ